MILNSSHEWELHCHSHYSDGKLGLEDLFSLALEREVKHLAITDHDTAAGYRAAIEHKLVPDALTLYPATELSCLWNGRTVHIVGLGIAAFEQPWLDVEAGYFQRRQERLERILFLLEKQGFQMNRDMLDQQAAPALPARPHIADFLVNSGQVKSHGLAFKKWLGQGKVGDVKQQWPSLAEAVEAITQNQGMAVLAHPHRYKLTWTKARELLDEFQEAGGQAVEVSCIGLDPELRKFLVAQARQRHMWVSGGSDFHRPETQWVRLGHYPSWPSDVPLTKDWLASQPMSS